MIVRSVCGMVLWGEVLRATTPPFIRYVTFRNTQGVTEGQVELEHFMRLDFIVPLRLARLTLPPRAVMECQNSLRSLPTTRQ